MKIFVHTNDVQLIGAKIAVYSFQRALPVESGVTVELLETNAFPSLMDFHGTVFNHKGKPVKFDYYDIQSFTLLRLAVPSVMQYESESLVVDPDVFWASKESPCQMFSYVTDEQPIACVYDNHWRTSVLVTKNERLEDWDLDNVLDKLRTGYDYKDLIELKFVNKSMINQLPPSYNCFDALPPEGKIVHFTRRQTQPWRTGLMLRAKYEERVTVRIIKSLLGRGRHLRHPKAELESLFLNLARDALAAGFVTGDEIIEAQQQGLVRRDLLDILSG